MKELCFIVNVDWFFHSHRRPLEQRLALIYKTSVIAGNSGLIVDYAINKFEVSSRIPTLRGIYQLYNYVKKLDINVLLIVVSPVMIIICHFLFRKRRKIIYNFSGLGFLRSKSYLLRKLIIFILKIYPVTGSRVFVVQNSDDFNFLNKVFGSKKEFYLELIAGSGYHNENLVSNALNFSEITIGYVGRIRKDKGVIDLLRAVSELQKNNYKINLVIWGELDDKRRHGFNKEELNELKEYKRYFKGFNQNKYHIYNSFNWFCLPSNGEGISKAAIESSSFGIPLVLSNVPGNRDMIKDNGYLFEFSNSESLKNTLLHILTLSKKEYIMMSKNSQRMFEQNWTIESVCNKWIKLLNKYDTIST